MDGFTPLIATIMFALFAGGIYAEYNRNVEPIEHKIKHYCTDIGSELQSYDRDDELVSENGATFTYKLEDE